MNSPQLCGSAEFTSQSDIDVDFTVYFQSGAVNFLFFSDNSFTHNEIRLLSRTGQLNYLMGGRSISIQKPIVDSVFPSYNMLSQENQFLYSDTYKIQWHVLDHLAAWRRSEYHSLCSSEDALCTLSFLSKVKSLANISYD